MKIEVDVLGVEQAVDFNTMETSAFVVISVLDETVRVPISEDQMARLTIAAVQQRTGQTVDQVMEETEARSSGVSKERAEEPRERNFSVISELSEHEEGTPFDTLFGDGSEDDDAKIAKLRGRPPLTPAAPYSSELPQAPGLSSIADDDFPQD